ncbi:MAG: hypothetical protein ABI947_13895 [Chloroflexota bacterium]
MLVRTFRLTDKLSNAFLRLLVWSSEILLIQAYRLRLALVSSLEALWFTLTQAFQSGQVFYQSSEERRQALMARRTAESSARPAIREDPLKTQNRALSMFTVGLMAALLVMVLWFTGAGQNNQFSGQPPRVAGGSLLSLQTKTGPTSFPTIIPTGTPIPDPLQSGGSIVYTMRERGHDNLWALGIGQSNAPIRLTNTPADDRDPVWSPDGSRIAFASHRDGNWELYVMEVATGNTSRLTYDLGYEGAPTWSPDGKYIAYEGYEKTDADKQTNLDIHIIAADGSSNPIRVTYNAAPDFSPAWSPDGRRIAYVSLRDNNQEIYIISLERPVEDEAVRLTNTPTIDEDHPVWSPDGQTIAYSARVNGLDLVFTKLVAQPQADPVTIGQGREPAWSPNGSSLLYAVDNGPSTTFVGGQIGTVGVTALAISVAARASHPNWTSTLLPNSLVQSGGLSAAQAPPLYKEEIHFESPNPPYNRVAVLAGITAPNAFLSDKVDDSFVALRQDTVKEVGFDFLGKLQDALWGTDRPPEPGQSRQSWHYAGRSIDFDKFLVFGDPVPPVEVVREDVGVNTYWRVYIRVPEELQGGQLGEPLKRLPWDFASRSSGDPQSFENGGRNKAVVPSGYYVDFTQLAEDFGWTRVPAERTWRSVYSSILYWEYDKRDNMSWNDAMLQLYTKDQIESFLSGPAFAPTPRPQPSETAVVPKTATPIPPDAKTP